MIRKRIKKKKIVGTKERPRLVFSRSNRNMFAQIVDDVKGETLLGISTLSLKGKNTGSKVKMAFILGEKLAELALKKKIKKVSFDKNNYRYLGRVKALAEGARKRGLEF